MCSSNQARDEESFERLIARAIGYLSGDALYFLLGFLVYGWLIRILSTSQYGHLTIATSIYQIFMMIGAAGVDMIGPKHLVGSNEKFWPTVDALQNVRFRAFVYLVSPGIVLISIYYHTYSRQPEVSVFLVASLALIFARITDVSYAAISLGSPGAMAKSRLTGVSLFLLSLVCFRRLISHWAFLVVLFQSIGMLVGRQLMILDLKRKTGFSGEQEAGGPVGLRGMALEGLHAGGGQVLMLACNSLDSVWLGRSFPASVVGEYATISRLFLFGTYVLGSVLNAYIPSILSKSRDPESFRRTHLQLSLTSLTLGCVGGLLIAFFGPKVAELLAGHALPIAHQVAPAFGITFLVVAAGTPNYSLLPALGLERSYLLGVAGSLLLLLVGFAIFIPWFGCRGAIVAQGVALMALTLYSAVQIRTKLGGTTSRGGHENA